MSACLWKSQYLYKIAFGIWLMPGNTSTRNDDVCRLCCTQRKGNERQRERERERGHRERGHREREREREGWKDRQTHKIMYLQIGTHRKIIKQRQTYRLHRQTHRKIDRQSQTYTQIDRHTDEPTDIYTGRQTHN